MVLDLQYRTFQMPRKRYPHLPIRPRLYEGINPPASQKTLLTVRQINTFYDTGHAIGHTRTALNKAELTPVAFGPATKRNGQPPMLFRAGDAKRALQMANVAATYVPTASMPTTTPPLLLNTEKPREETPYGFTDRQWQDYSQAEPGVVVPDEEEPDGVTVSTLPLEDGEVYGLPEGHATTTDEDRIRESVEITFNAIVDDETCDDLLQKVTEAIDSGAKAITLWISSEGGSLFTALGMYDRLRYLQRTNDVGIYTVATGYVLSAGTILMAAGARRFTLAHTVFMLHEPYQMPWESGENAKVLVTEIGERQELHDLSLKKIAHIFYERDSRPEADYESWLDIFRVPNKSYFGAEEALQWGLVDSIL